MKKFLALLLAAVMLVAVMVPAIAAEGDDPVNRGETRYEDWNGLVSGKKIKLDKYLLVPEGSKVPTVTFEFKASVATDAECDDATNNVLIAATDTTAVVYRGIEVGKVKVLENTDPTKTGKMEFKEGDTLLPATDPAAKGHVPEGFKFVRKDILLDFSEITFPEPGIYRYFLQEDNLNNVLVQNDVEVTDTNQKTWRTIDVYVLDDETSTSHKLINNNADPSTANHEYPNKPSHYIVYEGKLLDDAPGIKPNDYADPGDFDITRNMSGFMKDSVGEMTKWTYVKAPADPTNPADDDGTYVYQWKDGAWEETFTADSDGLVTINRNRDDYLNDATSGAFEATSKEAETYRDAVEMNAPAAVIQAKTWTLTDENNVTHTWVYDAPNTRWNYTAQGPNVSVTKPDDAARAKVKYKGPAGDPNVEQEYDYGSAKGLEEYIDGELIKYDWVLTGKAIKADGTTEDKTGTNTVYHWNGSSWEGYTKADTVAEPDGAATTAPKITVNSPDLKVTYKYAEEVEKKLQKDAGYNIKLAETPNGAEAGEKSSCYVNKFAAYKLEVTKKVTGNQGSRDKYFKFTIEVDTSALKEGDNFIFEGHKLWIDRAPIADGGSIMTLTTQDSSNDKPNAATEHDIATISDANSNAGKASTTPNATDVYTIGTDGKVSIVVYLHDGEKVVLRDLPEGAKYTVKEDDGNKDGYRTTVELDETGDVLTNDRASSGARITTVPAAENITLPEPGVGKEAKVTDATIMANAAMTFINERNGVIPTGVAMGVGGAAALLALAAVYFVIRRKLAVDED